ncbi:hypothetical protein MAR_008683 [Mya arenaria]|uniref:Uncharacterized protein n=1 Tax=Mya arenaria TaxID=6604 RepID=A0ABY7DZM4_MYAAR|nr:hypothetical protein MAR_008683 [Mya arenaria]
MITAYVSTSPRKEAPTTVDSRWLALLAPATPIVHRHLTPYVTQCQAHAPVRLSLRQRLLGPVQQKPLGIAAHLEELLAQPALLMATNVHLLRGATATLLSQVPNAAVQLLQRRLAQHAP